MLIARNCISKRGSSQASRIPEQFCWMVTGITDKALTPSLRTANHLLEGAIFLRPDSNHHSIASNRHDDPMPLAGTCCTPHQG